MSLLNCRCSPVCGAVSGSDELSGAGVQTWLHSRARVTFTVADPGPGPGPGPAPTCETGSPGSGSHTQLSLYSHRSVCTSTKSCGCCVTACSLLRKGKPLVSYMYSTAHHEALMCLWCLLLFIQCPQTVIVWTFIKSKHMKIWSIRINSLVTCQWNSHPCLP